MQQFPDGDAGVQLLPDFAADGLLGRLAGFDLAAGKLPPVLPVAAAPLGGEDAVLGVVDDGGGNGDMFHNLFVLVEDDQRGDDARHPSSAGEDKDDEDGSAPAVDDGQRRKNDGEDDAENGHKEIIYLDYSAKISVYGLNVNNRLRLWPVDSTRYLSLQRSLTMSLAALYEIPQI